MILPLSNFCFNSGVAMHGLCWLYGCGSAHTVVEWPVRMIKGNPGIYQKGLGGMETLDNACMGAKSVRTHPLREKTNIKVVHVDREHWNKPRKFSILLWYMDNNLSVRKIQIFYSSKRKIQTASQYISYILLK